MSEAQKLVASLSGAVAAHLLLLVAVFFLIGTRDIRASLATRSGGAPEPNEVTILMGDLMELVELEAAEPPPPEPDPEDEAPPETHAPELADAPRPFIDTALNAPEPEAPEDARFESDRNTRAASELPPDANDASPDLPTTRGDLPLPYFALQERRFVDGEFDRPPAPDALVGEASPSPFPASLPSPDPRPGDPADLLLGEAAAEGDGDGESVGERMEEFADGSGRAGPEAEASAAETLPGEAPAEDPATAEAEGASEPVEGVDTPPEHEVAETMRRPAGLDADGGEAESRRERSYLLPEGADSPMSLVEGRDREAAFAAANPDEVEAEAGESADLAMSEQAPSSATGDGREEEQAAADAAAGREAAGGATSADSGLFAPGFSPEQIQNATSGTLSNRGQNAVDAEGTPVGRYKAAVQQAIARKWHQYRHHHGEFVTWGVLKLECRVDRQGRVHGLRVVDNQANAVIADFSLRAILDAELPPMPPEVAEELGVGGLLLKYDIIIY